MQKYGQHFLINEQVISQIIDATLILKRENLVEIGPGKGALTQRLIDRGQKGLTLIEIDPEMVRYLKQHLPTEATIRIVEQNFLSFELDSLPLVPTTFISNLPYIDAAEILDKVLNWEYFSTAVFMFQKEQAQRIRAKAGEAFYGPLSIFSQLRAFINPICKAGRSCFSPPPKVESAVLSFEVRKEWEVSRQEWLLFVKMVNSAFLHRRKTFVNSLGLAGYKGESLLAALAEEGLPPSVRPEQISPRQYARLFQKIK